LQGIHVRHQAHTGWAVACLHRLVHASHENGPAPKYLPQRLSCEAREPNLIPSPFVPPQIPPARPPLAPRSSFPPPIPSHILILLIRAAAEVAWRSTGRRSRRRVPKVPSRILASSLREEHKAAERRAQGQQGAMARGGRARPREQTSGPMEGFGLQCHRSCVRSSTAASFRPAGNFPRLQGSHAS
jgi:hypothetical protein